MLEKMFFLGAGMAIGFVICRKFFCAPIPNPNPKLNISVIPMYVVKADNPDVRFNINFTASDSEGNSVPLDPEKIEVDVTSTNPELVEIIMDDDDDPMTGIVRFGRPSVGEEDIASVEVRATYDGNSIAPVGAQFMIVAGDPTAFSAPTITFDGLTEVTPQNPDNGGGTGTGEDTGGTGTGEDIGGGV
jgi:hypothetical protein